MSAIPLPPPDLPEVSGNKQPGRRQNYNNNNGLSPNKSSETDSSSNTSSKNATPSHPTTQTDRSIVSEQSPASKPNGPPAPPPQETGAAEIGEKEKVWERCWSLAELKQGSNTWTLASDAGLLKYLQDFSLRVTSRTHEISSQVDGLSLESQSSCGRLENVSNKFHKLSMEQFVENRVFDEDETDHTRTERSTSDAAPPEDGKEEAEGSGDGEVRGRANQAVKLGLSILDEAFDQVDLMMESDSDSSGEDGAIERSTILPTELEPKDLYLLRPFPSLIGSATFYETDHLGLRLQESSDSEYGSDVYESEGDSSGTETELRQKQRQKGRPEGTGGLAEDVGDSSGDLFSEDEGTKPKSKEKGRESPPLEEGGLFNTKQGKFDEGNLFDSSSEDEDLFSEGPKKKKEKQPKPKETTEPVPVSAPGADSGEPRKEKKRKKKKPFAGAVPVFGILDSDDSEEDRRTEKFGESVSSAVSVTSQDILFDSDSDGDLFSSDKPATKAKKANTPVVSKKSNTPVVPKQKKQEDPPVASDIPSTDSRKDKTLFGGGSLNFDDSDSETDLFESTKVESSSSTKKPIGGVKIFAGLDQDALMGRNSATPDNTNSPIAPIKAEIEKVGVKKPNPTQGMSLYEDSSSDDDLFSSMSQAKATSKVVVKKEEYKKQPKTDTKVPDSSKLDQGGSSSPATSKSQLVGNGLNFLEDSDGDSGDDLFSKPLAVKSSPQAQPLRTSDRPSDRPVAPVETGEMFGGSNSVVKTNTQHGENEIGITESKATLPNTKVKKEAKPEGLFPLGSDSDEDLFNLVKNKPVKAPEKHVTEQKPEIPLPDKKTENGGLFSKNEELFSAIQPTPGISPPPKPTPTSDLFSELTETDGDDLFGGPASLNLFAATNTYTTPKTAPKPKAALPTLFAPIDTGTSEGSLFEQPPLPTEEHVPLPPQQDDTLLPSLANPPANIPDNLPPTQQDRKEQTDNSVETLVTPKDSLFTNNTEVVGQPVKSKVSVAKNKDFLNQLNKAMGKGFVPGEPMLKKTSSAAIEDEGDLFSNTAPKGAERGPMGAGRGAMGASRVDGYEAEEEPSKLVGMTRNRPRGPAKRPQSRDARKKTIQPTPDDFGGFFTEPNDIPNLEPVTLFNGALEGDLFAASSGISHSMKFPASTKPVIETDIFSGNPNKSKLNTENNIEEELFHGNSHVPVKFHSSKVKLEDHIAPVPTDAGKKTDETPPLETPEDLFASIALPKATKSSKSGNKQKIVLPPTLNPPQTQPEPNDIGFEENAVVQEKPKKSHKVVKRTDDELFGGDDLFDVIPDSKPKPKSDKTKKKKTTDSTKKTKKVKEFDPSTIDDIFD